MRTMLFLVLLLYFVSAAPVDNDETHIHEENTFQNHRDPKIFNGIWRSLVGKITQTVDTGSTTSVTPTTSGSTIPATTTTSGSTTTATTTSSPTTTSPKLPPGAGDVAEYDLTECTPQHYLIKADCFCGKKEKGKGKICNKNLKCIATDDKDERLQCISPDKLGNLPCGFNDKLLEGKEKGKGGDEDSFKFVNKEFSWRKERNEVPFYYSSKVPPSDGDKNVIKKAMEKIEEKTCFKFIEESAEDYEDDKSKHILEIFITDEWVCKPSTGSVEFVFDNDVYFPHKLRLLLSNHLADRNGVNCGNTGLVTHELMHVLGVAHTQTRKDRDDYIKVNYLQVPEEDRDPYLKNDELIIFDSIPYECGSIMHYGKEYDDKTVIVPRDKKNCKLEESNNCYYGSYGTEKDYELLNIIGKCAGECYYQIGGKDYDGDTDKTESGLNCEKWNSQIPYDHNYENEGDHNFCRNPSNGERPWCYHRNGWEYCDIPYCGSPEYLKEIQNIFQK